MASGFNIKVERVISGKLARKFGGVNPFSVLDSKSGLWQDRKAEWKRLGIKSELGRNSARSYASGGPSDLGKLYKTNRLAPGGTGKNTCWKGIGGNPGNEDEAGTSIFDPVLCEMMYEWFCLKGGKVWDQFAGGSVRGIVAAIRGFDYLGVDIREDQLKENERQWWEIEKKFGPVGNPPKWIVGDASDYKVKSLVDFIFTCPPYGNLEKYSDDPKDLSNMDLENFNRAFAKSVSLAYEGLKENRFACWVVGDYRGSHGFYVGFPSFVQQTAQKVGFHLYNEGVLLNVIGSLQLRVGRAFNSGRKLGKCHQNILIFWKGDRDNKAVQETVNLINKEYI